VHRSFFPFFFFNESYFMHCIIFVSYVLSWCVFAGVTKSLYCLVTAFFWVQKFKVLATTSASFFKQIKQTFTTTDSKLDTSYFSVLIRLEILQLQLFNKGLTLYYARSGSFSLVGDSVSNMWGCFNIGLIFKQRPEKSTLMLANELKFLTHSLID